MHACAGSVEHDFHFLRIRRLPCRGAVSRLLCLVTHHMSWNNHQIFVLATFESKKHWMQQLQQILLQQEDDLLLGPSSLTLSSL